MHSLLSAALEAGLVHETQLPKSKAGRAEGYAYFDFLGGAFDGCRLRLYAPLHELFWPTSVTDEIYENSPPKDKRTKRRCYRLREDPCRPNQQ